jgi:hypothetical protein
MIWIVCAEDTAFAGLTKMGGHSLWIKLSEYIVKELPKEAIAGLMHCIY